MNNRNVIIGAAAVVVAMTAYFLFVGEDTAPVPTPPAPAAATEPKT
jgi:hypothetical protein